MSAFLKILSPISLAALLLAVTGLGRAQDTGADGAVVPGDLPVEEEQALQEAANRDDSGADENSSGPGPVPSAALDQPSAAPASSLLPVVPPVSRYEDIWKNSPFELEAAPDVVTTAKQSFAKDYALSGMLKQGDETIIYIINKKTKETHRVTSEGGGEGGFKLQSLQGASNNVRDVEATIEKDGEVARITYDKTVMAAAAGAALKNHPSSQRNADQTQNPRSGVGTPQDRSAAAAAVRARQLELAARSKAQAGGNAKGGMGTETSSGATAGNSQPGGREAVSSAARRRIVLPKAPAPQERK